MKTKLVLFKIRAGGMLGQETSEEKRKVADGYIARLKSDGENVISVEEKEGYLHITLQDK